MIHPAARKARLRALCAVAREVFGELARAGVGDARLEAAAAIAERYCDHDAFTFEEIEARCRELVALEGEAPAGSARRHAAAVAYELVKAVDAIEMDSPGAPRAWMLDRITDVLVALGAARADAAERVTRSYVAVGGRND